MQPVLLQENDIIQFGTEDEDVERESVVIVQVQLPTSIPTTTTRSSTEHSPPIYSKVHKKPIVDAQMNSQQRLTDVMRKLSTLGMQLNTKAASSSGEMMLSRLALIEESVEACLGEAAESTDCDTIHTRPTLGAALNIIVPFILLVMCSRCMRRCLC